jgi:hypothetical protein
MSHSIASNSIARKSMAAIVMAAAITVWAMALPKPAQAGCWGCWVVPGTSHAFMYGSIYGPYFTYPAYSEYGFGDYGYTHGFLPPPPAYYSGHYGPYLFAHHRRTYAHRD